MNVSVPTRRSWLRRLAPILGLAAILSLASLGSPSATDAATTYRVPILMYHLVDPVVGNAIPDLVVTPAAFAAQMKALHAQGWHTITAAQLGAKIKAHSAISRKTFVITIDDARQDGYSYAYPILRKYGFVATYYVITGRINRRGYLSWDELAIMARHGMEIGNHTVSHADVRAYHGTALVAQIDGAAKAIVAAMAARGLAVKVTTFAYPYGKTTATAHNLLKARGYTLAVTEVPGSLVSSHDPLYAPRIRVSRGETAYGLLWSMR